MSAAASADAPALEATEGDGRPRQLPAKPRAKLVQAAGAPLLLVHIADQQGMPKLLYAAPKTAGEEHGIGPRGSRPQLMPCRAFPSVIRVVLALS